MIDKVNRFIEDQKLNNPMKSNPDLAIQLIDKLNIIISILNDIKNKQFNIVGSQDSGEGNGVIKTKEIERPFVPTVDTSSGNIQAADIQKRSRKIDLKDSVHKLNQISK